MSPSANKLPKSPGELSIEERIEMAKYRKESQEAEKR